MTTTASEEAAIRAYRAKRQREWWARMTPEERRARRDMYTMNAIRREQEQQETNGEGKE